MSQKSDKQYLDMKPWQQKLHDVIFGYESFAGKLFDVVLLIVIIMSVIAVMLESVTYIAIDYGKHLRIIEWIFTILFAIEYAGRITSSPRKWKYVFSFMGIIDLLAILPTFISIFIAGAQTLLIIRFIRLVRFSEP